MAKLGKRERQAKRERAARIASVDYSYKIRCSHDNHESSNHVARVCHANLRSENPMHTYQRHYIDLKNGVIKQKSFG